MHRTSAAFATAMLTAALLGAIAARGPAAQEASADRAAFLAETGRLRQTDPALYEKVREGFTLVTEMLLGRLGYDVGPFDGVLDDRTREAVRQYERDHGLPVTGDPFSYETLIAVRADDELLNSAPINLQPRHVIFDRWSRGFVSADGTWTSAGADMASPEQTSNITCERAEATCREARATVSGRGAHRLLGVDLYTFEIERWDDREIVTKPLQFGCVGTVIRWDRIEGSVVATRRTTSNERTCATAERVDVTLRLEDGNVVARTLAGRQQEAWRQIMRISPEIVRKLTN